MSANIRQVAGGHYGIQDFQVWDAWWHWNLDPFQCNIIKYVIRHKGGLKQRFEDLDKALHYIQKYVELLTTYDRGTWNPITRGELDGTAFPFSTAVKSWNLDLFQEPIMELVVCGDETLKDRLYQLELATGQINQYKKALSAKENNNDK